MVSSQPRFFSLSIINCEKYVHSTDDALALYVDANTRIQILETMVDLPRADKEQCGAFIVRSFLRTLPLTIDYHDPQYQ